jgi:hypothetical protein
MPLTGDQWSVLRALRTGDPPHAQGPLAYATDIEEPALLHALEGLASTDPPLAEGAVDTRRGERVWTATTAGKDALEASEPPPEHPLEPLPPE